MAWPSAAHERTVEGFVGSVLLTPVHGLSEAVRTHIARHTVRLLSEHLHVGSSKLVVTLEGKDLPVLLADGLQANAAQRLLNALDNTNICIQVHVVKLWAAVQPVVSYRHGLPVLVRVGKLKL